ncbi:hypothetical protein STEG23_006940, partial [Scotinomys teguina]
YPVGIECSNSNTRTDEAVFQEKFLYSKQKSKARFKRIVVLTWRKIFSFMGTHELIVDLSACAISVLFKKLSYMLMRFQWDGGFSDSSGMVRSPLS